MIKIPREFMSVRYVGKRYPGAAGVVGVKEGANCQQFAYELLRHFGRRVPDLRSSDLWADEIHTKKVSELKPLDLLFFTKDGDPWAAHIAVYLGESQVIHLSKEVGYPQILGMDEFSRIDRYKILLGAKRVRYETEELVTPIRSLATMIIRLDHIQLAMPPGKENRAREFWSGLLGMAEESKPEPLASRGGCWFRTGDVIVHIGVEKDFALQKKAHPAFCVGDLDDLASRLATADCPVVWDEALPNRRRFYTADPFGNRIEFIADGDGFGQK